MINFEKTGNILYFSPVDVSLGNGPGVNEREFIISLYGLIGNRAHFVIPMTKQKIGDLPTHNCTFFSTYSGNNIISFIRNTFSQIRAIEEAIKIQPVDLIVFRIGILPIAPYFIVCKNQIPFVLRHLGRTLLFIIELKLGVLGKFFNLPNLWLVKQLLKKARAADVTTALQVKAFEEHFGSLDNKLTVIDNAVNTTRFFPQSTVVARENRSLKKFDPLIGYVGNLAWERGGRQLIEAARILKDEYPDLGVLVLGGGDGLEQLKSLAECLELTTSCVFTGSVPYESVPLYINALDVGVSILSYKDFASSEQKVRQYIACGKPVVASSTCNDFLVTENLGSIVDPENIDQIATEIGKWLNLSSVEKAQFAESAHQYAKRRLSVEQATKTRLKLWSENQ